MAIWFQIRDIPDPYQYVREREKAVFAACEALQEGGLVVFPTETVYGIGCDAMNESAVRSLFERKQRPLDKALLLHLHDRRQAAKVAWLNEEMWSELFMENRDYLFDEVEYIIKSLMAYRDALMVGDRDKLKQLLREGREAKERVDASEED